MMSAFLDFINVGSVAVLLSVCMDFGRESLVDWRTTVIASSVSLRRWSFAG
jgi:chromate transporter